MTFHLSVPKNIEILIKTLQNAGFSAYIVGGSVRDALMEKMPHDFDIATSALPNEVKALFKTTHKVIETGIKHGTVTVICEKEPVEITTFRIDGNYTDSRHPEKVTFTRVLALDLERRDFTVNALAYDISGRVADFYGGLYDLKNKILRAVGDPDKRFTEDALRILRALRFSAQLDFSIEEQTSKAIHEQKQLLKNISYERISAEFTKLLASPYAERVTLIFKDYQDVFSEIIPEIQNMDNYAVFADRIGQIPFIDNLRLYYFLHCTGIPRLTANKLRLSRSISDLSCRVSELLTAHSSANSASETGVLMYQYGKEAVVIASDILFYTGGNLEMRKFVKELLLTDACVSLSQLAVNGNDLLSLGIVPQKIGKLLEDLLAEVLYERLSNEREKLLEFVNNLLSNR